MSLLSSQAMTAAEATPRRSFSERFVRAASAFLDSRILIILGAAPQREFPLG